MSFLAAARQPWTSNRRDTRSIGTVKFHPTSRTLRANVEVSSLENVRSPALMWISEPGVAPLSRAYPRLMNAVPSGLSRRFATKLNRQSFSTSSQPKRSLNSNATSAFQQDSSIRFSKANLKILEIKEEHTTSHALRRLRDEPSMNSPEWSCQPDPVVGLARSSSFMRSDYQGKKTPTSKPNDERRPAGCQFDRIIKVGWLFVRGTNHPA